MSEQKKSAMVPFTVAAAACSGWLVSDLGPMVNPVKPAVGLEAHDSHAAASLLGQFRTGLSSWMFLRADLYLHNGVEMRLLTQDEVKAGRKGVGNSEADKAQLHDDSLIVTVVPPASRDFRGWIGDLERATSSYKDMTNHSHNNPRTTLPLFRLMTWLDPQFAPGWTTGATILRWENTMPGVRAAHEFLSQGLEKNPNSIAILTQIGFLYMRPLPGHPYSDRDIKHALPYLEKARSVGVGNFDKLTDEEKEALMESYRWLGLCYRDSGKPHEMLAAMTEGNKLYPEDPIIARFIETAKALITKS